MLADIGRVFAVQYVFYVDVLVHYHLLQLLSFLVVDVAELRQFQVARLFLLHGLLNLLSVVGMVGEVVHLDSMVVIGCHCGRLVWC